MTAGASHHKLTYMLVDLLSEAEPGLSDPERAAIWQTMLVASRIEADRERTREAKREGARAANPYGWKG